MGAEETAGPVQRLASLGQHSGEALEHVRNTRSDLQRDRDVGGRGSPGKPHGVVEQDLVRAGLDEQRREPVRSAGSGLIAASAMSALAA